VDHATGADGRIEIHRDGGRLDIVIDNPARKNAMTVEMIDAITAAITAAAFDDAMRVVVLRSTGNDFCTGIDLAQSNESDGKPRVGHLQRRMQSGSHGMIRALRETQLPVVAGVSGWAAGVGNALALSADIVVADESAQFWVPFVGKGFSPDSANSYLLPRLIGTARAKEMIMRAKPVPAETALQWGMISQVVAVGELDAAVDAIAAEFATAATIAVGLAKTLIHRNVDSDLTNALQNEAIYEELAVRSDDFKEGMRAFVQRRPPEFTGR